MNGLHPRLHTLNWQTCRMIDLKQTGGLHSGCLSNNVHQYSRSDDSYSAHLQFLVSCNRQTSFKQPWELSMSTPMDVCNKRFKCDGFFKNVVMPPIPKPLTTAEFASKFQCGTLDAFKDAGLSLKKKSDDKLWEERLSFERKAAYKKWNTIILKQIGAFDISRNLIGNENIMKTMRFGLTESVMDALGMKATSTLHARSGPMVHYIDFCERNQLTCFPLVEQLVYEYAKSCENRAPTYLRSFMLAISFAKFHFGLHGAEEVLKSGRIRGFVEKQFSLKRKLLQRSPLSVKQVATLEETVRDVSRTAADRLAAGFFLLLVYGRLRYSDAQQLSRLRLDMPNAEQGFLEGVAERTKTSLSLERKTRLLPIAIPTLSLSEEPWIPVWLDLRKELFGDGWEAMPMLPSPGQDGRWSKIPLGVSAGSSWVEVVAFKRCHRWSGPWNSQWKMYHFIMVRKIWSIPRGTSIVGLSQQWQRPQSIGLQQGCSCRTVETDVSGRSTSERWTFSP